MRRAWWFALFALFAGGAFVLNLMWGTVHLSFGEIWRALWGQGDPVAEQILWDLRFPRAVAACLAGAALGVSGLVMQTVFRNPLAGPYVLGVSSGAGLGVALVLLFGVSGWGLIPAAGMGAMAVMFLILAVSRWTSGNVHLLIIGLMVGYVADAWVSLLIHFGDPERLGAYVGWGFGSFSRCRSADLPWFAALTGLGIAGLIASLKFLNVVFLGEDSARSLGFAVARQRTWALMMASWLTAVVTVYCGPIGFLGLIVPHLARWGVRSSDHRILMPAVGLLGGGIALWSGWVAHSLAPGGALPLNAVTALIGAPVVLWILWRERRGETDGC